MEIGTFHWRISREHVSGKSVYFAQKHQLVITDSFADLGYSASSHTWQTCSKCLQSQLVLSDKAFIFQLYQKNSVHKRRSGKKRKYLRFSSGFFFDTVLNSTIP